MSMDSLAAYSCDPREIVDHLVSVGVTEFISVPDMVQLSLNRVIDSKYAPTIRSIYCATEDEAFAIAAGLYIGGQTSVVSIQNQGLFAGLNNLRAVGLDARIPIVMLIGQFGREPENFGADPRASRRVIVSKLEPLLDVMEISYFRLESRNDSVVVAQAFEVARATSRPVAVIIGAPTTWIVGSREVGEEAIL